MPRVNTLISLRPNFSATGNGEFYSFSANTTSVNEGNTVLFTVSTRNVSETTLYWTIKAVTGTINVLDTNNLSGSFNLTSNVGTFLVPLLSDATTEGSESFIVEIRKSSTVGQIVANSSLIVVNDTSLTPLYTLTANTTSVNEGNTVSFTVDTQNVANGTVLYWTTLGVSGTINSSDFSDSQTQGTVTINNSFASFNRTLSNDVTTEGTESFRIQLRTTSSSGTIVANSQIVTISDTSLTPPPTGQIIFQTTADLGYEETSSTSNYRRDFTTNWTVPSGVTSISVVCIGSGGGGKAYGSFTKPGGGGGGSLSYKNNISVTPGETLSITYGYGVRDRADLAVKGSCSTIWRGTAFSSGSTLLCGAAGGTSATEPSGDGIANGSGGPGGYRLNHNGTTSPAIITTSGTGGFTSSDGGARGGNGGTATTNTRAAGGGGAGGYGGIGGSGGTSGDGTAGSGGGGGGGGSGTNTGGPGGGTSPYGQESDGAAGVAGTDGTVGGGGTISNWNGQDWPLKGYAYGGGGGSEIRDGIWSSSTEGAGGKGCVRIIWPGDARQFPSTRTADE